MIRRLLGLVVLGWVVGFGVFMLTLAGPLDDRRTDAIVVLTGGKGRIARGFALLQAGAARRLLVSGVAPGVRPRDLARENAAPRRLLRCCVDLGYEAVDTRSNAQETADWVRQHHYRSVRLVTSDWHMARARMELKSALGPDVELVGDGVASRARPGLLVSEYHKLLLRRAVLWFGVGQ